MIVWLLSLSLFQAQAKEILKLWYWTTDLDIYAEAFEKKYPNVDVQISQVPRNDFLQKLTSVIRTKSDVMPDVIPMDVAWMQLIINKDFILDLEESYGFNEIAEKNFYPYLLMQAKGDNGNIRFVPLQNPIGVYYYRRSIAKEVFGMDAPSEVAKHIATWDDYIKTAKHVEEKTNGRVKMLASADNLMYATYRMQKEAVVIDNKLNLDGILNDFYTIYDPLNKDGYTANLEMWQAPIYQTYLDASVFGYFLPSWALRLHLPKRAEGTEGDWGIVPAPGDFFIGGSFIGINAYSKKQDLAYKFLEFITTDQEFLQEYTIRTQDYTGNMITNDAVADAVTSPFTKDQKPFKMFNEISRSFVLPKERVTKYDDNIMEILRNRIIDYSANSDDKDGFQKNLETYIRSNFHELKK